MAFYNDFRPRRFDDLVGNVRLGRNLIAQIQSGSTHHTYLFSGHAGTGKTTTARLLASSLVCASSNGTGGCGNCSSCLSVQSGSHWDVREMDGAHFRGVEDTDELARTARLYPLGEHKIYIIDECHRLSAAAWDVLLKLLEEPPPFLTVILCTTEPNKVPETITSRCSICAFDRPTDKDIENKLLHICADLGFEVERGRLLHCISSSKGNFRAAENMLEQAYSEYVVEQIERLKVSQ